MRQRIGLGWILTLFWLAGCVGKPGGAGDAGATPPAPPSEQDASSAQADPPPPAPPPTARQAGPLSNADDLGRAARKQLPVREAPVALTSSDGQGLELRSYVARGVIDGPLSHCELRLTFHNTESRRREGRFELVLPDGATVARFAMKTGGRWMEGEVVEKQRARRVYEDFLHRRQDPALLEATSGNRFAARVFPIEPNADKEIILAFSAERRDPLATWTLPLVGLPELATLDIKIFVHGQKEAVTVRRERIQPAVDLEVHPGVLDASWSALRAGRVAVVRLDAAQLQPTVEEGEPAPGDAADPLKNTIALVDTSASGALAFEARLRQVEHLARRVADADGKLVVVAFDQDAVVTHEGGAFGDDALVALRRRGALGASDLGRALTVAGEQAARFGGASRVVLFTDGIATAGERDGSRLSDQVRGLAQKGVVRLDAVTATASRDEALLGRLVGGTLPRDGVVIHAGIEAAALDRLTRRTLAPLELTMPGAAWIWPNRIVGLEADGSALVWAELNDPDAKMELQVSGGATGSIRPESRGADERLLERTWARARVALLENEHDRGSAEIREAIHKKVVELSLQYRVLSRWTALLVLETDADYARYGIARTDRAAILTIGEDGVLSLAARDEAQAAPAKGGNKDLLEALGQPADPAPSRAAGAADEPSSGSALDALLPEAERGRAAGGEGGSADADDAERTGTAAQAAAEPPPPAPQGAPVAELPARVAEAKPEPALEAEEAPAPREDARPSAPKAKRAVAPSDAAELVIGQGSGGMAFGGTGGGGGGTGGTGRLRGLGARDTADEAPLRGLARGPRPMPSSHLAVDVLRATGMSRTDAERSLRRYMGAFRVCFDRVAYRRPTPARSRILFELAVDRSGRVGLVNIRSASGVDGSTRSCVESRLRRIRFVGVHAGLAKVTAQLRTDRERDPTPVRPIIRRPPPRPETHAAELRELEREVRRKAALRGVLADAAGRSKPGDAVEFARAHVASHPSDLLGYVALGDALRRDGKHTDAARAYGSLIDLFPDRADMRRFAGNLLEATPDDAARALALDSYAVAVQDRNDHPTGWLMRALAEARAGRLPDAIRTLDAGLRAPRRSGNFPAWERTAKELMAVFAGVATRDDEKDPDGLIEILRRHGTRPDRRAGTRLLLTWENDANDVDLHVFDKRLSHASFRRKIAAGGRIFADVTTGWGPECFATSASSPEFRVFVHSYRQGPMGFGMGRVLSLHSDGKGKLRMGDHPFVVMQDRAYVDLGTLKPASEREVKLP
jgi:tetratricopeptide (TPR) repeat protein